MKIESLAVGYLETNCYILSIGDNVLVIDPGDEYDKIEKMINGRNVVGVIITHYHPDHVGALDSFNCPIYDSESLKEGSNSIGDFSFEMIVTKGHTKDSITLYFKNEKAMFTGDFLFEGTIGRTDFPGGSFPEMKESIEKIKKYEDDIKVFPGHGNSTILGVEKRNNPYFS